MSVQSKILAACLVFVAIIAMVGGLAQQQASQMGRLAVGIYDHAFMGMSYVDQAQSEFLRLEAARRSVGTTWSDAAARADLQKVLERLDVALERASSDNTREAGRQTRVLLAALPDVPEPELAARMTLADKSITKLVKKFAADGLETRDDAEELAAHSTRLVLIQIAVAICLALGVGYLVGRNLSRPLVALVRTIGGLAAGDLEQEVAPALARRRDEIGAVARAAAVFREAMRKNARADEERDRIREKSEAEKLQALRDAANSIEQETSVVAERSAKSGGILSERAEELAASAVRMLTSVEAATGASNEALSSCEIVAAAGEELSVSAMEIARQIASSAAEVANTARAGERAREIIERLSASMGQIGTVARLIGDIAGRTNLLALNATIEAARAGEAGRGFAVVASEVKALATQTAHSTDEIARSVNSIQSATRDAVAVVAEMVGRVASIEHITEAIAAAAEEQTAATGEIARSVVGTVKAMRIVSGQVGSMTQEARGTDAAVNEMRSISGAVADQIAELRSVMVRIVRTSSDAANRREDGRTEINVPAKLLLNGEEIPVMCVNLSRGGARAVLQGDGAAAEGASVALRLPGLPDLTGKVLHAGREISIRFAWEPDRAPAELREWLSRKAAA
jgi:methyl-accepting chemotaxis protein